MERRRVVAMGGGGFSMEPENPLLDEFVRSLARAARPRVCFVPTASGERLRRPTFRRLVETGELGAGWAADDGAALVFAGDELDEVVSSRPLAAGYRVERVAGRREQRRLPARYLGSG